MPAFIKSFCRLFIISPILLIIFYSFSIEGMEFAVFNIAIFGTLILFGLTVITITSKMLDGFGKSYYGLAFSIVEIIMQIILISYLNSMFSSGYSVLMGLAISMITIAFVYVSFLRDLFIRLRRKDDENNLVVI